jgi:hypothetical protein
MPVRATETDLQRLRQQWYRHRERQAELTDEIQKLLAAFRPESTEVRSLEREREALGVQLAAIQTEIESKIWASPEGATARNHVLLRPVAVELKNATIRQAIEVLSKATKVPIEIPGDVPDDLRLTVQARGVSFGAVLQAVARQANLKISPSDKGILLTPWPMVEVNDQLQVFKGARAPWALEWGVLPGYRTSDGWDFPGEAEAFRSSDVMEYVLNSAPGGFPIGEPVDVSPEEVRVPPSTPGVPGGYSAPVFPGLPRSSSGLPGTDPNRSTRSITASAAMAISLASLGDRTFAVSEPGRGTDGQLGAWITVYRMDGTQLKKVAAGFHALRSDSQDRRSVPGMMPGMPGMNPMGIPGLGGALPVPADPGSPFGSPLGLPGGTAPVPATTAIQVAPAPAARAAPVTVRTFQAKKALTTPKK